ncbi:hypothetical protein [Nocardia huaxiensis]|uniref:Uncharacterized protein n=1 Tax=Nocardia huaxiensis TaxID=2755382 RepID=A0A7D6ZNS5_9NOCA|nr:hypothetical protein [Nocardia huaxiensis]QLY29905.1 hypothetical protein H0264_32625 [Nocardia huaxiensis]UFS96507.1 hypothetical protein LPY97_00745 [Nocardia huaxiensis]
MTHHTLAELREFTRHWLDRYRMTPQERANRAVGYTPPAVVSASLGYHAPRR